VTALSDAQIDRYSRQIIMPGVGGHGQARLLAARIMVAGDVEVAGITRTLLARAGIGALADADGAVIVDCTADPTLARDAARAGRPYVRVSLAASRGTVLTLVGRPCALCVATDDDPAPSGSNPLDAPAALAIGALAASEALRVLLAPSNEGRAHVVDLAGGEVTSRALRPTGGCAVCGGTA
jgi:adenylyltransferase/sulfurtransferase